MARKIRRSGLICGIVMFASVLAGCSTVSGFGSLMGGIGRDISDTAEGARSRMNENGPHR